MYYYIHKIINLIRKCSRKLLRGSHEDMSYSFRLRVNRCPRTTIETDKSQIPLHTDNKDLSLFLSSPNKKAIKDSDHLTLVGSGYQTQEQANEEGIKYSNSLMVALAASRVAVDFGLRTPKGAYTKKGLEWVEKEFGVDRAENNVHGLMVYRTEPEPRFMSAEAQHTLAFSCDKFLENLYNAIEAQPVLTERELVAFTLFNASFFQPTGDSRFILLVMAIEAIIEPRKRCQKSLDLVSKFIELANSSDLDKSERNSILGSLNYVKDESIGQAGRRLVKERLGENVSYIYENPSDFFAKCYNIRSKLVHGGMPYPTLETVNSLAAPLELLVSELLIQPYIEK